MTTHCNPLFWGDDNALLESFFSRLRSMRVPLVGTIEITHRCNLNCAHCYIKRQQQPYEDCGKELGTDEWRSLIDEVIEAGCLFLLITGGEPLLRSDFGEIYRYAREKGLLVTVFTNGTLVNEEIVELFTDLPPTMVEISLYGATERVYESITGVAGSFEKCMTGIRSLLAGGIETRFKTILMDRNKDEFRQIEAKARELGSRHFRLGPLIMSGLDGSRDPLGLRVSAEEAVKLELSESRRAEDWTEFFQKSPRQAGDDRLFPCGAGLTSFSIDPYGTLKPCLMAQDYCHNIRYKGGFSDGWKKVPGLRAKKLLPDSPCLRCEAKLVCGYCPPFFKLETGDERKPPSYLCDIGRYRLQAIKNLLKETDSSGKKL
jgi:radical SAM protein with 4Fe4S-binding SPASM domain